MQGQRALRSVRYFQVLLWVRGDAALSHSEASHMENEMVERTYVTCKE